MRRTRHLVALLAVIASCANRFGLERVVVDEDGDGLLDEADNCPEVGNLDQYDFDLDGVGDACDTCEQPANRDDDGDTIDDACDACVGAGKLGIDSGGDGIDDGCQTCPAATGDDVDRDGVEDACDACLRGPAHDEDGDDVEDACDTCPTRIDPAQALTTDDDRIGDACDPDDDPLDSAASTYPQVPRLFDPFSGDDSGWETAAGWTIAGDAMRAPADSSRASRAVVADWFLVETIATLAAPSASSRFAIRLYGITSDCPQFIDCEAEATCTLTGTGQLVLDGFDDAQVPVMASKTVDVSGPVRLWMRSRFHSDEPGTHVVMTCAAIDATGNTVIATQPMVLRPYAALRFPIRFDTVGTAVDLAYAWVLGG